MASQASLLDLKAITAEQADRLQAEGKGAVKGAARRQVPKSKDPFDRPSPGLVKRLAAQARDDAKRRVFQDEAGPSDEQRRQILLAKARKYDAMSKGDYSGISQRELEEAVIDFDRKDDSDSDVDESVAVARFPDDDSDGEDELEQVEYEDEMGRTRVGTRKEKRQAERLKAAAKPRPEAQWAETQDDSAYAQVLESTVIHGDQYVFPVYEPDPDALRKKYREAEEEARAQHYDSTKEVRAKGAGQYQFSMDEEKRAEQMRSLAEERAETERARDSASTRGMSAAQEARKRKAEERRALVEAKRSKVLGAGASDRLREAKQAAEADRFLTGLAEELQ